MGWEPHGLGQEGSFARGSDRQVEGFEASRLGTGSGRGSIWSKGREGQPKSRTKLERDLRSLNLTGGRKLLAWLLREAYLNRLFRRQDERPLGRLESRLKPYGAESVPALLDLAVLRNQLASG
ncbi:MAG: hypothetical protein LBR80_18110 [Deltaproteobacteria bacterium]|jgi:hypothetical protein|nr:hypothetical protein [Deltaproteobacteria bacterium]